jgi:hypothetical protein
MAAADASKAVADSATTDRVLAVKLARAAGINRLRINGVTQAPDTSFTAESTSSNNSNLFLVGAYNDASGGVTAGILLAGRIYGLIIKRAASPSDAEITNSESWAASKAGLSL